MALVCRVCGVPLNSPGEACNACQRRARPAAPDATVLESGKARHAPAAKSWVIGTDPACDIVVDRPTVSRRHCRLTRTASGYLLEDLGSSNGTFVNGKKIQAATPVTPGDQATLGRTVPLPWPKGTAPKSAVPGAITIGRASDNRVVLDFPMVSAHHARIVTVDGQPWLEDLGSANGTAIGAPERIIERAPLQTTDVVYLGSLRVPAAKLLGGALQMGYAPHSTVSLGHESIVLGRDPSCDQVLIDPRISRQHARLLRSSEGLVIEDLRSAHGTFVNGQRIDRPTRLNAGDFVGLGSYTFRVTAAGNLEQRDYRGNVRIEIRDVSVAVKSRRLLADFSLSVLPSEFVGLMGPSGAGKTTLLNVLNGYTPPATGHVLFNGQDLYANFEQFQGVVGYVPQDDIMHAELTVGQALYYSARLRLPGDFSDREIHERIALVITQLGLEGTEDVLIGSAAKKGISGGQRKRVNLAMELLTDPAVLFLDEPTSGLSSEDTLTVMKLLRKLADDGKTILLTIHQPSLAAYRLMDNLVLVGKDRGTTDPGRLVYYGPAWPHAIDFVAPQTSDGAARGEASPDEVLRRLGERKTQEWVDAYDRSPLKRQFVTQRAEVARVDDPKQRSLTPKRPAALLQWWSLVRRALAIKLKDTANTAILLAQAPIIGLLIVMVFGQQASETVTVENWKTVATATATTVFLLALAALWFGCSNAAREIVGEWPIYHRERMVSLRISSYLAAKFTVLGGLCVVQCAILLGIVHWGAQLQASWLAMFGLLLLSAWVGLGIGLAISAMARTSEIAIALLPLILLPLVILGGVLQPTHQMNAGMRAVAQAMPSRWAFEGMLLTEASDRPALRAPEKAKAKSRPTSKQTVGAAPPTEEPAAVVVKESDMAEMFFPLDESRWGIAFSYAVLTAMLAALVATSAWVLRKRDVH